jgi:DNA invertase Pin-like site-specific DNA recombinase
MRVVRGYIRVSTEDQADGGLGLEASREMIRTAYARDYEPHGWTMGGIYEDPAVSSGVPLRSRKGGGNLVLDSDEGDVMMFAKLDRGFRNTEETLREVRVLGERGVRCVFLDLPFDISTPFGQAALTMAAAFSTLEKRMCGERTKASLSVRQRAALERGQINPLGNVSYGMRRIKNSRGRVMIDADQYHDGLLIWGWMKKGYTDQEIAQYMNANAHMTRCGYRWYKSKVARARVGMAKIFALLKEKDKDGKPKLTLPKGCVDDTDRGAEVQNAAGG